MEPELKTYLEERFNSIDEKFDYFDNQFKLVRTEISSVRVELLEVINDVKDNTSNIIERMDKDMADTESAIEQHGQRLDRVEDSMRVVKTKLAIQ